MARGMTVSSTKFGSGWMSKYEDRVHWRRVIAADEVEYDWQIDSYCYGRLHVCPYGGAYSGIVIDAEFFFIRDALYISCEQC